MLADTRTRSHTHNDRVTDGERNGGGQRRRWIYFWFFFFKTKTVNSARAEPFLINSIISFIRLLTVHRQRASQTYRRYGISLRNLYVVGNSLADSTHFTVVSSETQRNLQFIRAMEWHKRKQTTATTTKTTTTTKQRKLQLHATANNIETDLHLMVCGKWCLADGVR